ncbi:MAG: biotin--[acetyl-CoA-carboxylase] ligase [Alphaproteobacteria bacterium]|nr:biotin--[acetyl-CoA-carboxylase] ligase [Alphaproteobacteria bacterium]
MSSDACTASWPILRFDEIDSTNEEARRRSAEGDQGPFWIQADRQTAGRGRLGRSWDSPSGNLFATALFPFARPLSEAPLACFSAGLAVIDAAAACGVEVSSLSLKWPNDVLVGSGKVAGILIETGGAGAGFWMAAGFGVNIATAPVRADRETACLSTLPGGAYVTTTRFLAFLDIAFRARLSNLISQGFEPTRTDWLARSASIGARVALTPSTGRVEGVMRNLGHDGALVLELDSGGLHHVRAGEISILG